MVVISYSFWQALYVQTPWDGMAFVPLACTGLCIREIFVHNCSLSCAWKKLVSSAFANMPAWVSSSVHISGSEYTWEALLRCLCFANVCSDRDLNPRHWATNLRTCSFFKLAWILAIPCLQPVDLFCLFPLGIQSILASGKCTEYPEEMQVQISEKIFPFYFNGYKIHIPRQMPIANLDFWFPMLPYLKGTATH